MLQFRPILIEDKKSFDEIVRPLGSDLCAHCFTDLFMWKYVYNTSICIENGFVFIKQLIDGCPYYIAPLGKGNLKYAMELIEEDSKKHNEPFRLCAVNRQQMKDISDVDSRIAFKENRDNEDYIYTSESLINLSGKKLHSKRNFINRFRAAYEGRWKYENMTKENMREIFNFHLDWCRINNYLESREIKGETEAVALLMKNADELGVKGGLIRLDGRIIAITMGSQPKDDMFIVHIEKADHTIAGAYQMINNEFVSHNLSGIKYVNREEDMGIEGLRKAKLSYFPEYLGENYIAYYKEE